MPCKKQNNITELISNFKDEKWEAKNYNILTHNCQHFGAEVIKILNAIIKNSINSIDTIIDTMFALPNCIIEVMINLFIKQFKYSFTILQFFIHFW